MNAPLRQVFERVKGVMQVLTRVKAPGALIQLHLRARDGWVSRGLNTQRQPLVTMLLTLRRATEL